MITREDLDEEKSLKDAIGIIMVLESDSGLLEEPFCSKWDNRIIKVLLDEYLPLV